MFQINDEESESLRSQIATSKSGRGGRRYLPFVFTEHGALMAASVLNTPKAVELSVYVVRAFVRLRELLASNRKLAEKLNELESRLTSHDEVIGEILQAIRQMMMPSEQNRKRPIGFAAWEE